MWRAGASARRRPRRAPVRAAAAGGFTLLEVLIVLAILSLAATATGLALPGTGERVRLSEAGARLDRLLAEARTAARREGAVRFVAFDLASRRVRVEGSGDWQSLPEGVGISVTSAREIGKPGEPRLAFLPDGTSTGARITLASGERASTRQVDWLTGAIRHEPR